MKRISFFLLLLPALVTAQMNKNGDFQIWNYYTLIKQCSKNSLIRSRTELRFGDDASKLYLVYTELQWIFTHTFVDVAPGYRQIFARKNKIKWYPIYNPLIDVAFYGNVKHIEIEDRNRFQYLFDKFSNHWVYRNRFRLSYDLNFLTVFIDDEPFFSQNKGLSQNRFSLGIFTKVTTQANLRIFYMRRDEREIKWMRHNILVLHLYAYF